MPATRAPSPVTVHMDAEDLLIAVAVLAAYADRKAAKHLKACAGRLEAAGRELWAAQHPDTQNLPENE